MTKAETGTDRNLRRRVGDITNKKEASVKARAGALQSAIFNSANFSMIATDENGIIQLFNVGAERMLGYRAAEVMDKNTPAYISDPQEVIARAKELSAEFDTTIAPGFEALVFKARRGIEDIYELTYIRKDGSRFPAVVSVTALRDDQNAIIGYLLIGTDNTARKKLNMVLQEKSAQLEAVNKELESFSYSVSHDLRAPLRHVAGFVEMLKEECAAGLNEKSRHYLEVISDAALKMGCLIDDLLSFSRMGRSDMMKGSVDFVQLAQEVIEEVSRDIPPDKCVEWRTGNLPTVIGDQAMLRLVLVNLLSNAVKFSRGIEKPLIEVDALPPENDSYTLYVKDNGAGFDMKYADKLFGLFQRLHTSEEYEGTGIGLANVRRIITRHGGRTWAEGELNKGATFYFTLPQRKET